jgi:hypothetical protein
VAAAGEEQVALKPIGQNRWVKLMATMLPAMTAIVLVEV